MHRTIRWIMTARVWEYLLNSLLCAWNLEALMQGCYLERRRQGKNVSYWSFWKRAKIIYTRCHVFSRSPSNHL
ncbi:BnaA06g38820D [Brassica napus]|uniref:BnaA06g38820D protein n=1 Tax=Brassica napus TaxID=3708 RepID=A0A078IS11_BRANA|nr:BnaA06g38820D [Brassica napus]